MSTSNVRWRWLGCFDISHGPTATLDLQCCEDCGAVVTSKDRPVHERFHAILSHHARALAVLEVSHIADHIHDRYDVRERIGRNENNWSAEAFAEVVSQLPEEATDA